MFLADANPCGQMTMLFLDGALTRLRQETFSFPILHNVPVPVRMVVVLRKMGYLLIPNEPEDEICVTVPFSSSMPAPFSL